MRFKLSKKGLGTAKVITGVILVLVFTFIMIRFITNVNRINEENSEIETCRESVAAMASAVKLSKGFLTTQLKCPTHFINFKSDGVYDGKKKIYSYKSKNAKSVISDVVADEMVKCWNKFHEGKLELFREDKIFCVVCSSLHFETDDDIVLNKIEAVLKSKRLAGKGSYFDYLTGFSTEKSYVLPKDQEKIVENYNYIDTRRSKDYAILFVYIKGRDRVEDFKKKTLGATPGLVLTGLGIVGLTVATGGAGLVVAGAITIGGGFTTWLGASLTGAEPQWASFVVLRDYNKDSLEKLGCEELPASP